MPVSSFRDPAGCVVLMDDRVLRVVTTKASAELTAALESPSVRRMTDEGHIIASHVLMGAEHERAWAELVATGLPGETEPGLIIEHPRLPFASFPYEWCSEMLHAAGLLTLNLAEELLTDGLGLKDATPYNVLFGGTTPVFVDAASLERRDPHDATWLPYAQFVRSFILPLLVHRECGWTLRDVFLSRRDGLEPEAVYGMLGRARRLSPRFLFSVSIPTWLSRRSAPAQNLYQRRLESSPEKAAFILRATLGHLRRQLESVAPRIGRSAWSSYMETKTYDDADFAAKEVFVRRALEEVPRASVLDVGCNTGHFSLLAGSGGATVVSLDIDPVCVSRLYARAAAGSQPVLPLVADLARPSPALGWRNGEQPALIDRLAGRFDLVLMLALVHHLLVTERVPLPRIVELAADLTRDRVVLEYVGPEDPMFRALSRGRDALYAHVNVQWFEEGCRRHFDVLRSETLPGTGRRLYLLRKRTR